MDSSLLCACNLLFTLTLVVLPLEVCAFSSGAPLAACEGMVPTDAVAQTSPFPYKVMYTKRFHPGGRIIGV